MSKIWFITGSARGLGREITKAALSRGDRVIASARNPEKLNDLVAAHGKSIFPVKLDVSDPAAAVAAVEAGIEKFGRIDVVVNNAGYANLGAIEDFTEKDFHDQVDTNLWGVINVSRAALPVMREQGNGHIIQISSIGGRQTNPGLGPYQTAKYAVEGFTGVLRKEVGPLGIRVTSVNPGGIRTDWAGSSMEVHEVRDDYASTVGTVAGYMRSGGFEAAGDPEKMAAAIVKITDVDAPPAQLLLGSDAVAFVRAELQAQLEELERWQETSVSTDADGAVLPDLSFVTN